MVSLAFPWRIENIETSHYYGQVVLYIFIYICVCVSGCVRCWIPRGTCTGKLIASRPVMFFPPSHPTRRIRPNRLEPRRAQRERERDRRAPGTHKSAILLLIASSCIHLLIATFILANINLVRYKALFIMRIVIRRKMLQMFLNFFEKVY